MKILSLLFVPIAFFLTFPAIECHAQGSPSQIQRAEELLEKERGLRERIEKEERFFIREIVVRGARSLNKEEIEEITGAYQKRYLSKKEITQLTDLFKDAYKQKKLKEPQGVFYEIVKSSLVIEVRE